MATKDDLSNALRTALIAAHSRPATPFTPPKGPAVFLRPLTLAGRIRLQNWRKELGDKPTPEQVEELTAMFTVEAVSTEAGDPVFTPDDVPTVRRFDPVVLEAIAAEVIDRNGMQSAPAAEGEPGNPSTPS